MYRNNSSHGLPFRGYSPEEPSSRSSISRPSAKSIYMQRKEYSESITKRPDNFQHRVEHLITCDLDGRPVRNVEDGLGSLKQLDSKGKVWAQDMLLEVQRNYLQLSDIETKEELDSLQLGSITDTMAVLDSCAYNSILTITVQDNRRRAPQIFMFQCTETGAQEIKDDLDKAIQHGGSFGPDPGMQKDLHRDIRSNLENIIGQKYPGNFRNVGTPYMPPERTPSPPDQPPPHWNDMNGYDDQRMPPPKFGFDSQPPWQDPGPPPQFDPQPVLSDTERNVEILNHVLNDSEIFMGHVAAATPPEEQGKKKKKKGKTNTGGRSNLPPFEEYAIFLQKLKYGFNLLGKLNGEINNPSAPDFVHVFFQMLTFVVPRYPMDIPPSVLSPFLTEPALILLSQTVTNEEDQLWRALGECWNVPRNNWPNSDQIPPYTPVFYDGWEPPAPPQPRNQIQRDSRGNSQRQSQRFPPKDDMQQHPDQNQMGWNSPPPRSNDAPLYMQVIYDFMARNSQELSVMKGDVVEVIDKSKQWWKVRNIRHEEGHVPQNVLEPMEEQREMRAPPSLSMSSKPVDVRGWLEYKGFSKLTVRTLGVLSGELLLKMTRDEIRMVCPEEGGRVFFQLQAVKSSLALADENDYNNYNGY
ncbi:epidermal growth factor receptor kinase substrate 8-like protein 3b isoform X1 [Alosa sapidissima]|uniref:epidermal growth factor receptor kinase substrate 8-like protein 3b isoform X1 n=1 Tax=Alosa sapidissima TaxID=34773 RepID=UPI001C08428A|nr:epidermal growth factor receptor kinase substrate 8-like protein 3b isoform X1 [Alosa sapidissima]